MAGNYVQQQIKHGFLFWGAGGLLSGEQTKQHLENERWRETSRAQRASLPLETTLSVSRPFVCSNWLYWKDVPRTPTTNTNYVFLVVSVPSPSVCPSSPSSNLPTMSVPHLLGSSSVLFWVVFLFVFCILPNVLVPFFHFISPSFFNPPTSTHFQPPNQK